MALPSLVKVEFVLIMDTDEKAKRFRLHVVKEIYDTERDYTRALEFTVEVS